MIKRIDIFMPPLSQYGVLQTMTKDIYAAMLRAGVNCRLLIAQYDNPQPFLESIFSNPPECTLSLNGLLPDKEGNFFCDMINIPHVAMLLCSPNQFTAMAQSSKNIITCPDEYAVHIFRELNCDNVLFLPHGVDRDILPGSEDERNYDVVFLGSCIDYEEIRRDWKKKYPKKLYNVLDEAANITLSNQETPYAEGFIASLRNNISKAEPLDLNQFHLMQILDELEMYICGKDRVELIRGIKDAKVDIFGSGKNSGWEKYIGKGNSNVELHPPIPFEEAIQVMKKSKIVLNSSPWAKHGGHERIFTAIACGALLITSENPYMAKCFEDGKDIAYYYHGRWSEVNETVNSYLKDNIKRQRVAESSRKKVMEEHTWDHRVHILLDCLPEFLKKIQSNNTKRAK
jgi:spore maturation protein CgeB